MCLSSAVFNSWVDHMIQCGGMNVMRRALCYALGIQDAVYVALHLVQSRAADSAHEQLCVGSTEATGVWLQCRYVKDYLAVGEAPDQIRNCFQQRSRWCKASAVPPCCCSPLLSARPLACAWPVFTSEDLRIILLIGFVTTLQDSDISFTCVVSQGHFQVMLSKEHCPLLQRKLSFFMKVRQDGVSNPDPFDCWTEMRWRPATAAMPQIGCIRSNLVPSNSVPHHSARVFALSQQLANPSAPLWDTAVLQVLFCSGVWSYIVASIATPTFIIVPLLTIWFGIFPIVLSWWAALGLTIYYIATCGVSPPPLFHSVYRLRC